MKPEQKKPRRTWWGRLRPDLRVALVLLLAAKLASIIYAFTH